MIREFDERNARIVVLRREVDELSERTEQLTVELQRRESVWATKLRNFVAEINRHFAQYFFDINCVGEVAVAEAEDYSQWGIEIRVQYRAGLAVASLLLSCPLLLLSCFPWRFPRL